MTTTEASKQTTHRPDWIDGFLACAFLHAGNRERYEELRDEYLAAKALSRAGK